MACLFEKPKVERITRNIRGICRVRQIPIITRETRDHNVNKIFQQFLEQLKQK